MLAPRAGPVAPVAVGGCGALGARAGGLSSTDTRRLVPRDSAPTVVHVPPGESCASQASGDPGPAAVGSHAAHESAGSAGAASVLSMLSSCSPSEPQSAFSASGGDGGGGGGGGVGEEPAR